MVTQNPNLISKKAMMATSQTDGSGVVLMSEVLTKVNNAKDKPKKDSSIKRLRQSTFTTSIERCI